MDPFSQRRLMNFIANFRGQNGQIPTLKDLAQAGFDGDAVKAALKLQLIEEFYVTLTNGTIVKGYKAFSQ